MNTLREHGSSMFLSGVESQRYWDIVVKEGGIRNVLTSYYYFRTHKDNPLPARMKAHPDVRVFIDSGAFTFKSKGAEKTIKDWEHYIEEYVAWARANKDYIIAVANMDIEDLVGEKQVLEWNKRYFEPLEEDGVTVCYIWHPRSGFNLWKEYCRKYEYVGVSAEVLEESDTLLKKLFLESRKYNTLVHGMAFTKTALLLRYPFYSVDSSVDGDSMVVYKDRSKLHHTTIAELYNKYAEINGEIRTAKHETKVLLNLKTPTIDNNLKSIYGDLYGIVKHTVSKSMITLSIEGGKSVKCTNDHSIITIDALGNLKEISAEDLKVGDYVLSTNKSPLNKLKMPHLTHKFQVRGKSQTVSVVMDSTMLLFLGLLIGDGYLGVHGEVGLSKQHVPEVRQITEVIANRFNAKLTCSNGIDGRITNVSLYTFLESLGFSSNIKADSKCIPQCVMSLPREYINTVLKGLFSADGTAPAELSTVSARLKDDVVFLLEAQGIECGVSTYKAKTKEINGKAINCKEMYKISVRSKLSLQLFEQRINFINSTNSIKLHNYISNTPDRGSKRSGIPKHLVKSNSIFTSSTSSTSVAKWKGRVGRKYFELPKNQNAIAPVILDSDLVFLEIKGITHHEPVNVEVYDLCVREYEKFFANGVLVHNTTWLVGQQYGELNWFDGRKMRRLKKKDWQRGYKTKLIKPPFNADWKKLMTGMGGQGDTYELLRLNTIAYKVAEEHVQKRLGTKQYWLTGGKPVKRKVKAQETKADVEFDKLPEWEWFDGDMEDYLEYAESLNIDTSLNKSVIVSVLKDFRTFLLQEPEIVDGFHDNKWMTNAEYFTGDKPKDVEEAKELLQQYFLSNYNGELADYSSQEMEISNVGKPSDDEDEGYNNEDSDISYIANDRPQLVDAEFSEVEVNLEDISANNYLPLPSGMDEVDEYDKELRSQGITVTRDSKGRFLKGTKTVRNRKKLDAEILPKLICNTCYKSGDCPEYKANYVCAYNKQFASFDTRKAEDIMDAMTSMADINLGRLQKAYIFETLDGGMPTGEVSALINQNMAILKTLQDMHKVSPKAIMAQRVVSPNGDTVETLVQANPTGRGESFLDRLFRDHLGGSQFVDEDNDPDFNPKSAHMKHAEEVDYQTVVDTSEGSKSTKNKKTLKKKLKRK